MGNATDPRRDRRRPKPADQQGRDCTWPVSPCHCARCKSTRGSHYYYAVVRIESQTPRNETELASELFALIDKAKDLKLMVHDVSVFDDQLSNEEAKLAASLIDESELAVSNG